jgi:hypothetical protein
MGLILRDGLKLIAGGIVIGGAADPLTLAAAALAFFFVALLACWLPAARAARRSRGRPEGRVSAKRGSRHQT